MTTYASGPWTVGRCSWNEDGNVCYELIGIKQGCAPDARLIAAVPELLEVLNQYALPFTDEKEARAEFGDLAVDRELVRRAAIAKATGEAA